MCQLAYIHVATSKCRSLKLPRVYSQVWGKASELVWWGYETYQLFPSPRPGRSVTPAHPVWAETAEPVAGPRRQGAAGQSPLRFRVPHVRPPRLVTIFSYNLLNQHISAFSPQHIFCTSNVFKLLPMQVGNHETAENRIQTILCSASKLCVSVLLEKSIRNKHPWNCLWMGWVVFVLPYGVTGQSIPILKIIALS